jgi:hypothetical protein
MNIYRPVFENGSSCPFMLVAFNKKDARERMEKFLSKNEDREDYFRSDKIVDVEVYPETEEGVLVL